MSSFHFLSLETRQIILGYLDFDSLLSAVRTCRPLYAAYKGYEPSVMKSCLYTTITPEILPYAILILETAKSPYRALHKYESLITKRMAFPTETLRNWSWELYQMKEVLLVHKSMSYFIDDYSKKALQEFHSMFVRTEVCAPLSHKEWIRIARSFYAHLIVRQVCVNSINEEKVYQHRDQDGLFSFSVECVAEDIYPNSFDREQLYIASTYFRDLQLGEGTNPTSCAIECIKAFNENSSLWAKKQVKASPGFHHAHMLSLVRRALGSSRSNLHLSANEKALLRTWRFCNVMMQEAIADLFRFRCPEPPDPDLAEDYLYRLAEHRVRDAMRKSFGAYQYGVVTWDKERLLNSRLKDLYRKDGDVYALHKIYVSLLKSPASQNSGAFVTGRVGGLKMPSKEKARNKAAPLCDASRKQPKAQPISRAVSPDTISWCSDTLRALKKAKAMTSKLSLGAHRPQPLKYYLLGPVSSRRPDSRVSRRKKRH